MKITVVTGFTENYMKYGQIFLNKFFKYWPSDINLICYTEGPIKLERGHIRYLKNIPGYLEFMDRNNCPAYKGLVEIGTWKPKEKANNYSFRFDACKFALQGFIPYDVAITCTDDYLIWLDADVFTYRHVTHGFLEKILKGDVTYLGRVNAHSEIGFMGFKIPESLSVIREFRNYYSTDNVFSLKEWHSAYVFDKALSKHKVSKNNITPHGRGHVWFQSPLSICLDHCKGHRKDVGHSKEVDKWADKLKEQFKDYL